jgi:hypothetical protein
MTTDTLPEGAKLSKLYGGDVDLVFNPNSPRYRYTITDPSAKRYQESVRGVTTVLRDIIHKPDLLMWPMNMSHQKLFGAKWDETLARYIYDAPTALLKPDTAFTPEFLQGAMESGAKAHTDRSDRGKDIGTMAHTAVEVYLKGSVSFEEALAAGEAEANGELPEENAKALRKALKAFVAWWEALPDKQVLATERPVYSRSLCYAGTGDLIARIDGKRYMLDLKTTNSSKKAPLGIYAEYFMQLGAYAFAAREEDGEAFDDLGIIRVSKDGKLSIATSQDMNIAVADCERAFAFAIRVHDWLENTSQYLTDSHFVSHLNKLVEGRLPEN